MPFLTGLRLTELCRQRHGVSQPCGDLLLRVPVRQLKGKVLLVFLHHIGGGNISLVQVYFAIVLAAVGIITAILNKFIYYEVD